MGDSLPCCITGFLYTEGTKECSVSETERQTHAYIYIHNHMHNMYITCAYIQPARAWQPEYNERNQKVVFWIACSLETGTCEISLLSLPRFLIYPEKHKVNCFEWWFLHRSCQEHVFCDPISCWCPVAPQIAHPHRALVPWYLVENLSISSL